MKILVMLVSALGLVLLSTGCQSLKLVPVNAPTYNCLFSTNCILLVSDTVADFTTNVPPHIPPSTNATLSGVLQSRSFAGQPGTAEAGLYGYEYRLVLNKLAGTESVSISSMTIPFSPYSSFTYNGQPNCQAWVVTSGGVGSIGPSSMAVNGSKVTFNFNPPLTFSSTSSESTSSYFFGMISSTPPPATDNSWASFTGTDYLPGGGTASLNWLMLRVRTP